MRTKEQIIQLIKDDSLVLNCKGADYDIFDKVVNEIFGESWTFWNYIGNKAMNYRFDEDKRVEHREVIPMSEYLNAPDEVIMPPIRSHYHDTALDILRGKENKVVGEFRGNLEYTSQDMINYAWFVVKTMGQYASHEDANSRGLLLERFEKERNREALQAELDEAHQKVKELEAKLKEV